MLLYGEGARARPPILYMKNREDSARSANEITKPPAVSVSTRETLLYNLYGETTDVLKIAVADEDTAAESLGAAAVASLLATQRVLRVNPNEDRPSGSQPDGETEKTDMSLDRR